MENSFINYFDKTEIYKGMKKIDDSLEYDTFKYYFKISFKKSEITDDEFSEWDEENEMKKINLNLVYKR